MAAGDPAGETALRARRRVSVLFVDLVASTRLAREMESDAYFGLMAEVLTVLAGEVEGMGGRVLQFQGDAVLAAFPAERDGDTLRALRAARASLEAIEAYGRRVGLSLRGRAGLSTGPATSGWVGGEYTLFGSVVNLARRLCSAAEPGEALASAATRQQTRGAAEYDPLPGRELRDYPDEGPPWRLTGFSRPPRPPALALPRLAPPAGWALPPEFDRPALVKAG